MALSLSYFLGGVDLRLAVLPFRSTNRGRPPAASAASSCIATIAENAVRRCAAAAKPSGDPSKTFQERTHDGETKNSVNRPKVGWRSSGGRHGASWGKLSLTRGTPNPSPTPKPINGHRG